MRLLSKSWRVLITALVVSCVRQPIAAQTLQIDTLAQQTADALSHAKLRSVLVYDFVGPDEMDDLGQKLADDFRLALAKTPNGLQVADRSKIQELLKKNELIPANLHEFVTQRWFSGQTGFDAWISGTMSKGLGGLKLSVQAFCVKSSDQFYEADTSIPLTEDLKALITENEKRSDEFSSTPEEDRAGYSGPACIYCPTAQFTAEALRHHLQGTVVLEMTVDTEGHAKDIRVKVGLPYGLTQQAVEAVKEWRFKPGTGPDGRPTAFRTTIEVVFHSS
jgi:TonB family protein